MVNNIFEEVETTDSNPLSELFASMQRQQVEAMVYLARHQGLRAGVRPNTQPTQPSDEKRPPVKRIVFIETPEKSMAWAFPEFAGNIPWLDSLPQYTK